MAAGGEVWGTRTFPTGQSVTDVGIQPQERPRQGWKSYMIHDAVFEVPDRYGLQNCIGRGAFGIVCAAERNIPDGPDGEKEKVAVKKVVIREDNILEVKRLVRELYLLNHFDHENVIGLIDILEPSTQENFHDIYVVTELMDTDLHHVIRSDQKLTEEHIQFFLYQLLRGLSCIHSARVLHRDLKPSNIIVNANCDLRICDFGLAREQDLSNEMTDYVATRWYRAPELLMQSRGYGGSVDMWSVGCIFAELLRRKALLPGKNYLDQLHLILELVGSPKEEDIACIGSEKARNYVRHIKPKRVRKPFAQAFPKASGNAIDLLEKMLVFNPEERITAKQCLAHPLFEELHDGEEPDSETFHFDFDITNSTLTVFELKEMLWAMLCRYHPEYKDWKWYTEEEKSEAARQKRNKQQHERERQAKAAS